MQFKYQTTAQLIPEHHQCDIDQFSLSKHQNQSTDCCQLTDNKFKKDCHLQAADTTHTISSEETSEETNEKDQKDIAQFDLLLAQATDTPLMEPVKQPVLQQQKWQRYKQSQATLVSHLKTTMKCDKYLRLITSVIKTYRAFQPKNRVNKVYKEIVLARRVIRFESKYDTLIDLLTTKNSLPMVVFKLFQLTGDLTDFAAFWLKVKHQGTKKCQQIIDNLQQLESDFYFFECCIWLCVYSYKTLTAAKPAKSNSDQSVKAEKKAVEDKLKAVKYLLDVLTSYNNSSLKSRMGEISPKLAGMFTFVSSCIAMYILWR